MNTVRVMGIDPGSKSVGVAVIEFNEDGKTCLLCSQIKVSGATFPQKLAMLREELGELFNKYSPHRVAVEKIFLGRNVQSAFVLGHARGVILSLVGEYDVKLLECSARGIKKAITGSGSASKEQIQIILQQYYGLAGFSSHDASDALALATFGVSMSSDLIEAAERRNQL